MNERRRDVKQVYVMSRKQRNIGKKLFRIYDRVGELIPSCQQIMVTGNSLDPRGSNIVSGASSIMLMQSGYESV